MGLLNFSQRQALIDPDVDIPRTHPLKQLASR
jgi:hypothetical protein